MIRKLMPLLMVVLALTMAVPVFGAASETAGEVLGFMAPTSGQTVRLPIMLLASDGTVVIGEAFNTAGMSVTYSKDGDSGFTSFPTFATENWDEIGNGLYMVIIRESDAGELALLDTLGHFYLHMNTTAARGDVFTYKINPADIVREDQYSDALATSLGTLEGGQEDLLHSNWDILYVDAGGDNTDGSTWAKAHQTITAALTAASDKTTIFVAAGTYAEAITIANNNIELKTFDFLTPFDHSTGTVRITGSANQHTVTVTGDYVEIIGFDITDHATGAKDGIYVNGANDLKITKCTIEGINGELNDGIRVLGNSRELAIFGCHIYGAESNGINITAAETHTHIENTEIRVKDGATAAINFAGTIVEADIDDCDLFAEGTVAQGILLSSNTLNCAVSRVTTHNFTTPYTDNGTTNSFVDIYATVAYAVAGDEMDLIAAPNATAITAIQFGLSTFAIGEDVTVAAMDTDVITAAALKADANTEIATAVADFDLAGYEVGAADATTIGGMLALLRAYNAGRIALSAGGVLTVYEVDGVTVIATANITDGYSKRSEP